MRHLIISVFLLIVAIFGACSRTSRSGPADLPGLELVENLKFKAADSTYSDLLQKDPNSLIALYGQGLVLERQLFYYDALYKYFLIIEKEPAYAPAHEGKIRILSRIGPEEELAYALEEYAKLNVNDWKFYFNLAKNYIRLARTDLALVNLEKAQKLGLELPLYDILRAEVLWQEGKFDSAETIATASLAKAVPSALFYNEAAEFYQMKGLVDSAIMLSHQAVTAEGHTYDDIFNLFFRCLENNYFSDARRIMYGVDSTGETRSFYYFLEYYYYMARQEYYRASVATFINLNSFPNSITSMWYHVETRSKLRDLMSCDNEMDRMNIIMSRNKYQQLFYDFMQYRVAMMKIRLRDFVAAEKRFNEITDWRKETKAYLMTWASILHNSGRFEMYDSTMEKYYNRYHTRADWLTAMADVHAEEAIHKYIEAEKWYRQVLTENNWYLPAYDHLTGIFTRLKQYDRALQIMNEYPDFVRRYPRMAIKKALCLVELNRYDEGLKLFEENIIPLKKDIVLFERLIDILMRKFETDRTGRVIDMMLQLNPDNPDFLVLAAVTQSDLKNYKKALETAERALAIEPAFLEAEIQKAFAMYWLGQKDEAFALFEKLNRENYDNLIVQLFYSITLVNEKKDMGKTGNMVRTAVGQARYLFKSYLNMFNYNMADKRYKMAIDDADNMIILFDDNPRPYYYMGLAMYKNGDKQARTYLQKAIDMGLKGEELDQAKAMINKLG